MVCPNPVTVYGPYRRKDGRAHVIHYWFDETAGQYRRRTESYPRHLWRLHYGEIPEGMDVDHIDGDRSNDAIENLQLLDRSGNMKKAHRQSPTFRAHVATMSQANQGPKVYRWQRLARAFAST
jgi:hypothetical protein